LEEAFDGDTEYSIALNLNGFFAPLKFAAVKVQGYESVRKRLATVCHPEMV